MTQLEHLQNILLSIAKDIDNLCRSNGIDYYLIGGSAIGAVRHGGFIPWDDDLDIIMDNENYKRFLQICRSQLDKEKYCLQVGLEDWPLNFSKIKLKGTILEEKEGYADNNDMRGIYVDIFKMDNVSDNQFMAYWQYFCGKCFLSYTLSVRKYKSASFKKKMLMLLSTPMKIEFIRNWILNQTLKSNKKMTRRLGFYYGRTRWNSGVVDRDLFGKPLYVKFEDTFLPVPEKYNEYLTQVFGDYMKLPPIKERVGLHLVSVDFGKY